MGLNLNISRWARRRARFMFSEQYVAVGTHRSFASLQEAAGSIAALNGLQTSVAHAPSEVTCMGNNRVKTDIKEAQPTVV